MPGNGDAAPAWALELRDELRALRLAVEQLSPAPRISRNDRDVLVLVLPALEQGFGEALFLAAEGLADPEIRALWTGSVKAFGKFLARVQGVAIAGRSIQSAGQQSRTTLWKISSLAVLGVSRDITAA